MYFNYTCIYVFNRALGVRGRELNTQPCHTKDIKKVVPDASLLNA